jgi:hypothetical protein
MPTVTIDSDHPIIFVYDEDNLDVTIPEYSDERPIDANLSCVSIGTQYRDSGPTEVRLVAEATGMQGTPVFQGRIDAPSKTIGIHTSEREGWAKINVRGEFAELRVWVNDAREASVVVIEAK